MFTRDQHKPNDLRMLWSKVESIRQERFARKPDYDLRREILDEYEQF